MQYKLISTYKILIYLANKTASHSNLHLANFIWFYFIYLKYSAMYIYLINITCIKKKISCNWANDCKLSLNVYIYEVHIYLYINCSQYCNNYYIRKVDVHVTWPLLYTNAKIIHIQILGNRTYF